MKCLECGTDSSPKLESFVDIQLPIKNESETGVSNTSIQMALENELKPEILEGVNQYYCDFCKAKRDAQKGVQILKTASVISLSLNRFVMNYTTLEREKINDKLAFPFVLNMNDYLHGYEGIQNMVYDTEVQNQ